MAGLWYYARDEVKSGPFSQRQLKDLAAAGTIRPIDTVWQEGMTQGAAASRVKNLFPRIVAAPALVIDSPAAIVLTIDRPPAQELIVNTNLVPLEQPAEAKKVEPEPKKVEPVPKKVEPKAAEKPKKKGRAVALRGADVVSQDGTHARYRKKCTECGHKDSACHMIVISNRLTKDNFFCPKCRKRREVAIQCHL